MSDTEKERLIKEIADENDATRRCVALEGEASFYQWFNDDALVPPFGDRRERTKMIEARIRNHKGSVQNEETSGEESQQKAES
jgi:hypothetical protein